MNDYVERKIYYPKISENTFLLIDGPKLLRLGVDLSRHGVINKNMICKLEVDNESVADAFEQFIRGNRILPLIIRVSATLWYLGREDLLTTSGIGKIISKVFGKNNKDETDPGAKIRVYLSDKYRQKTLIKLLEKMRIRPDTNTSNLILERDLNFFIKIKEEGRAKKLIPRWLGVNIVIRESGEERNIIFIDEEIISKVITNYGTSLLVDIIMLYYYAFRKSIEGFNKIVPPDNIRIRYFEFLSGKRRNTKMLIDNILKTINDIEGIFYNRVEYIRKFSEQYMSIFRAFRQILERRLTKILKSDPRTILDQALSPYKVKVLRELLESALRDVSRRRMPESRYLDLLNASLEWLYSLYSLNIQKDMIDRVKEHINSLMDELKIESISSVILSRFSYVFDIYLRICETKTLSERNRLFKELVKVLGGCGDPLQDPGLLIILTATLYEFVLKYFYPLKYEDVLDLLLGNVRTSYTYLLEELFETYDNLEAWLSELGLLTELSDIIIEKIKQPIIIRSLAYLIIGKRYGSIAGDKIKVFEEKAKEMINDLKSHKLRKTFYYLLSNKSPISAKKLIRDLDYSNEIPLMKGEKTIIRNLLLDIAFGNINRNKTN